MLKQNLETKTKNKEISEKRKSEIRYPNLDFNALKEEEEEEDDSEKLKLQILLETSFPVLLDLQKGEKIGEGNFGENTDFKHLNGNF